MRHLVLGEAANGDRALTLAGSLRRDVILVDLRMPGVRARLSGTRALGSALVTNAVESVLDAAEASADC